MTTNSNTANDAVFDEGCEVTDVDIGGVGVAAVRTPPAPVPDRACWAAMENYAALITSRTPMRALPLPLTQNEPATVAARISQLPSRVAAVFLIGLDPSGAAHVQRTRHPQRATGSQRTRRRYRSLRGSCGDLLALPRHHTATRAHRGDRRRHPPVSGRCWSRWEPGR
jgi:hypothetical protein